MCAAPLRFLCFQPEFARVVNYSMAAALSRRVLYYSQKYSCGMFCERVWSYCFSHTLLLGELWIPAHHTPLLLYSTILDYSNMVSFRTAEYIPSNDFRLVPYLVVLRLRLTPLNIRNALLPHLSILSSFQRVFGW